MVAKKRKTKEEQKTRGEKKKEKKEEGYRSCTNNTKKRVSPIEWGRRQRKRAGPQNGDSTGDCEGQARIQIRENVAFD